MKALRLLLLAAVCLLANNAFADPQLTSWVTNYSGQYARVYTTTAHRTSDTSATTWTNHSTVAYADIAQILYSSSYVYVRTPDLPSYRIGPWLNPQGAVGTLWPSNQHGIHRFPRTPTTPSTKTSTGTGYSGLLVNGLAIFNFADGKAWDGSAIVSGPHIQSTYYWHRSAPVAEDYNFDYTLGHQNPAGVFHVHQQPIALRYQLGDHVDFNSSTKNYSESTSIVTNHSPILGWAYDGNPIYGPYGYSVSNNASSGIRRMVSGYVERDGSNGTDNLTNNLGVIPAWYARYRSNHFGGTYSTVAGTNRPSVDSTYPLGTFAQDWSHMMDLTNSATGKLYVAGTNTYDLDVYGGRYCVTPEFPSGTYAYFVSIDSTSTPTYPYIFGFEYYGGAAGGSVSSITESVTTNFTGASDFKLTLSTPTVDTNYLVTLVWSSTEGGTYQVESSTNQVNWNVEKTGVAASVGVSTTTNYTSSVTGGTAYVRLTRTALATNDSVGGASGVVGQTNVQSFLLGNTAPTVANPISTQTATYGSSFSYTFPANTFSDADSGQTLTYTASSTVFTNTGISFNSATRTFSATTVDATNGGTIAGSYNIDLVATDNGSPAKSATNTFTLTINKATASVTPSSTSRTYGASNPSFSGSTSGFVAADSITASYGSTANTTSSAGTYSITATLTDPGTRLGNYTVTTNTGTLTVTTAPLIVTGNSTSRTYGVTNPVFTGTVSTTSNSDNITATFTSTATTNSAKGTYSITPVLSDPGSKLSNYTVTTNAGTLTVSAAPLTVMANSTSRNYGVTNPVFTGTITGLTNADSITATFTSTATSSSTVGNYSITPVLSDPGSKLGNYTVTTNTGTLTVSAALLSVTANSASRAYGSVNPTFSGTITGLTNSDNITATYTSTATTNSSPGTYSITPVFSDPGSKLGNYSVTTNSGTLTVTQAVLLVTADAKSRAYGATNPTFTATYSGFVNGQTSGTAGLTGLPSLTTTADTNSAVGSYTITSALGTLSAANYSFNFANGTLTVTQAVLLVSADAKSRTYGATNPTFTASYSGFVNGQTSGTAGLTGSPSLVTGATTNSPVGNYTITNSVGTLASANYSLTFTNGTLTVTAASLTVAANSTSRAYGSANPTFSGTITGLTNADNITATYTTTATTNSVPGTYSITPILTDPGSKLGNYSVTTNSGTLTVTQAVLLVTADAKSRTYGAVNPTFTASYSGFVNGQTSGTAGLTGSPSLTTTADTNSAVGSYTITSAMGTLSSANYSLAFSNGTLTVTTAPLTVTANSFSRAYGSANPTLTGTVSGLQNSDSITANYATTANSSSPIGSYSITVTLTDPGTKLGNYSVTTNNGTLTVTNALPLGTGVYAASDTLYKFSSAGSLSGSLSFGETVDSLAFDAAGNLYLFKSNSTDIVKYSTTGNVTTFASGLGGLGKLAFDTSGYLYAAISNQNKILKFDTNGVSSVYNSNISGPRALAFDKYGRLYASTGTNSIVRLTSAGTSTLFASNIANPTALAFDNSGYLYVANSDPSGSGSSILKYDTNGTATVFAASSLTLPYALAFDQSGNLFVADVTGSGDVMKFTTDGAGSVYSGANAAAYGGLAVWPLPPQLILSSYSGLNEYATFTVTNSLISLLTNGTANYTFTNPDSGNSITVTVTAIPLSSSNNSPVFQPLDFYGPNGTPVHASINSSVNDGNWVDYFESARFTATLVSASSGISTNTVEFGIAEMGIRNSSGTLKWTSTTTTNSFVPNKDTLYTLDSGRATLAGTNYSGLLAFSGSSGQMQFSDFTGTTGAGIVFNVRFYDGVATGTNATLASSTYTNNQFQFAITGTTSATYIVQATTNVSAGPWVSISTNTAPFSFTDTNTSQNQLRFYRVISGQ